MAYEPRTRLYVTADLAAGASIVLSREQAHYLERVLRLARGARLALFNGRDGEWSATIDGFGKGSRSVSVGERLRAQREEGDLWLVFAPVKRARIDFLVEKATELGASALQPVVTERTQVERVNLDRLRANVMEAAEQTERLTLPEVRAPVALDRLLASWPAERRLLFCDETGESPDIATALAAQARGAWAVLIGPEGGFAQRELDLLRKLPFVCPVGLGPRVLRADTAALAALAVFQALLGDWARRRG
ncbi:MAG TPA: 16S rRNA (uracil(1498)-N(3))-methyltransferase [Stellaceae bacterium]|nr:16S rRNA (uracil(1498)-N(3))-methyltransferase [Stellaceae bacterium]